MDAPLSLLAVWYRPGVSMDWEIRQGDTATGPFAETDVEGRIARSELDPATLVRPVGRQAWKPATRHGRFAAAARKAAGVASVPPPPSGAPESKRAPDVPYKDPSRWDQQTQLNMVAAPPAAWMAPPPPAPFSPTIASAGSGPATLPAAPPPTRGPASRSVKTAASPGVMAPRIPEPGAVAQSAVSVRVAAPPARGFVTGLFDLSFTTFVTTRVLKVLYVLFLGTVALGTLGGVILATSAISTASSSRAQLGLVLGCAQLLGTLVVAGCMVIVGRIVFESVAVFFRIAEHLAEIDRKTRG